jgi:hypothetical protein
MMLAMIVLAAPIATRSAQAQNTQVRTAHATTAGHLDVAFTYDAARADRVPGATFWMQGAGAQIEGRFYRGLGAVAEVAGTHAGNINASGVGLDLVTAVFGPRYTWTAKSQKYAVFGQAFAGEAFGFNSVFPAVTGATVSSYSLAVEAGGGLNIALSPRIALRAIEADWLRTQLPNATTNVQNNLRLSAGVVFRIR